MRHSVTNAAGQRAAPFSGTSPPQSEDAPTIPQVSSANLIPMRLSASFDFTPLPDRTLPVRFYKNRGSDSPKGDPLWNR